MRFTKPNSLKRILKYFLLMALLVSFPAFSFAVSPDEGDYEPFYPEDDTVSADFEWWIEFSDDVDISTAQDAISIYEDGASSTFPIDLNLHYSNNKIVVISHTQPFEEGSEYKLFVGSGLKSVYGKQLLNPTVMTFWVPQTPPPPPPEAFQATVSDTLEIIKFNGLPSYAYIRVDFNRQLSPEVFEYKKLCVEPDGFDSSGMPCHLYLNGSLTDTNIHAFVWENQDTDHPSLYFRINKSEYIKDGDQLEFSILPGKIKDIDGNPVTSEDEEGINLIIPSVNTPW